MLVAPKHPVQSSIGFGSGSLPPELMHKAIRRIGFIGLILAITAPAAFLAEYFLQPLRVSEPGAALLPMWVALGLLVAGVGVFAAAWSRKVPPALMLDLGLIFEVVVALGISLSENATPWPTAQPIRGISWNCIWIVMFVTAVPGTFGKSILAAFAAACMQPIGLAMASALTGTPLPPANQILILVLPVFVAAVWAVPAARHIHSLGVQLTRERELGSYRLVELIGRGGMGQVWRAEHRMLARTAAVKLIGPGPSEVPPANLDLLLRRFDREAKATASLRSPHTVTLYDYGISQDGQFYYVMELLHGADFDGIVGRFGPLPAGRVVFLLKQACKSLAEAHELGMVHRDLKPRNIFLCRMGVEFDFVKILDFGLAKYRMANQEMLSHLTADGALAGTPAYMAPEAVNGAGTVDFRSDLYSLGCVGYWMLTGRPVFEAKTAMATLMAHVQTTPTRPSERSGIEIPESLERVILACLEKNPDRRPSSARELQTLLESCDVPTWTDQQAESWWAANMKPAPAEAETLSASWAETI